MASTSGQPRKYSWGKGFGAFLQRTGKGMFAQRIPKQQAQAGKLSSPYFNKKHPLMQLNKVKRILGGMGGVSKREKTLDELRFENQAYNRKRKDDKDFSKNERDQALEKVRQTYGDTVAGDVEQGLGRAFLGSQAITSKKAVQSVSSVRRYGKDVQEGVGLIIQGFDPKFQSGREAEYITGEKFQNVVEQTEVSSGKYPAQVLRNAFGATEAQGGSKPKASSRIMGLQEGLLGWGRRSSNDTNSDNK